MADEQKERLEEMLHAAMYRFILPICLALMGLVGGQLIGKVDTLELRVTELEKKESAQTESIDTLKAEVRYLRDKL